MGVAVGEARKEGGAFQITFYNDKKKPVAALTLAGIGVEADEVGGANAWSTVQVATPKPPKTAGEKVTDEGEGGQQIADYLVAQKLV